MKKTIVIADRDESLQHAFMTVFSKASFEIIHASNGKEVERIAERINPDVYIVNVDLPKVNGIEVYKKLQKQKFLETASFFFLKDESDATELLGYQADGVIEKPINFFRVYETVTKEDDAIELTDLVEEKPEEALSAKGIEAVPDMERPSDGGGAMGGFEVSRPEAADIVVPHEPEPPFREEALAAVAWQREEGPAEKIEPQEPMALRLPEEEAAVEEERKIEAAEEEQKIEAVEEGRKIEAAEEGQAREEATPSPSFGAMLKDAMDSLGGVAAAGALETIGIPRQVSGETSDLEGRIRSALTSAMEEAAPKFAGQLAPIITEYVEDYVKRMLLEIAENVIREEIDRLLKESP